MKYFVTRRSGLYYSVDSFYAKEGFTSDVESVVLASEVKTESEKARKEGAEEERKKILSEINRFRNAEMWPAQKTVESIIGTIKSGLASSTKGCDLVRWMGSDQDGIASTLFDMVGKVNRLLGVVEGLISKGNA
jgi:hypothetical protein